MSYGLWRNLPMSHRAPAGAVLQANFRAFLEYRKQSARQLANQNETVAKQIQRMVAGTVSPTLRQIDDVAALLGLQSWQLLVPNLDPRNLPVVTMTTAERDLYARLRSDIAKLPPVPSR